MKVYVKTNAGELVRYLRELEQREIPFAMSVALNRTAVRIRDRVRAELPRRYTIRKPGVLRGWQVRASSKRQWPRLRAVVGSRDYFWTLHATGGIKRPARGSVAIPTRAVRRTKRGAIGKAQRPGALIAKGRARVDQDAGAIRATKTTKRRPLSLLYLLRRQVRIPKTLPLEEIAREEVARRLPREFRRAMSEAIKSSRRRASRGGR